MDPGSPRPFVDIKVKNFKLQHVQVELKLPTPIKKLHLEEGFLSACGFHVILKKKLFIKHIYEKHKGEAPSNSQINMPYWIWNVNFDDDDHIVLLYCRSTQG